MKLGFSGHQNAPDSALKMLADAINELSDDHRRVLGICSLAAGADQEFADALLRAGGDLEVVVPCHDYEDTFDSDDHRVGYQRLLSVARTVTVLPYPSATEEAFLAAGIVVVERCDVLLAVWDGQPASGLGGTADVVRYAWDLGKTVRVAWPKGLSR